MTSHFSTKEETLEWIRSFHKAADSLTTGDLDKFYIKDSSLKFGNDDDYVGLDAILSFFSVQFPHLHSMKHETLDFDMTSNKIYLDTNITYVLKGDPELVPIKLPAFGLFYLVEAGKEDANGAIIEKFKVFIDRAPIVARAAVLRGQKGQ